MFEFDDEPELEKEHKIGDVTEEGIFKGVIFYLCLAALFWATAWVFAAIYSWLNLGFAYATVGAGFFLMCAIFVIGLFMKKPKT